MALYRLDVKTYASIYVRADTEADAWDIARKRTRMKFATLYDTEDAEVTGVDFQHAPDVSFSPMMTLHGPEGPAEIVDD